MNSKAAFLSPAEAARRLGVSAKALRLYEEHRLLAPSRTQAGWRAYGSAEMARAHEIVALRGLGLSLAEIGRVLAGDAAEGLASALAAHAASLDHRLRETSSAIARVRELRNRIADGGRPSASDLSALSARGSELVAAFDLPWPWGGERFELRGARPLTWITGPLASGKTKLAMALGEALPGGAFIGLERAASAADAAHGARMERTLDWLAGDGAARSDALVALVSALEHERSGALVFDLIEQGLDEASQCALAAFLRRRGPDARPVFAMTRSSAMLDLAAAGQDEIIILCPANHSPPLQVAPYPGAAGYEAVVSCLAPPDVRARTEGIIAMRAPAA